jgi:AraC-like DNA-binding protein
MDPYRLTYILITFGYVIIFGTLGATTLLLQVPNETGLKSYIKSRKTLGYALTALSVYSIIRLIIPQNHAEYIDFWLLITFTLIHSWLTYSSLLFLLETPRYVTRRFIIDGLVPSFLIIACGIAGIFSPQLQPAMQIVFGCIFGLKCAYMFYVCLMEYRKCENELDNYYDEYPDIKWIKGLIYLSLFMSAATLVAFYVTSIHLIYYLSIPVIYTFIIFKIINFAPKRIDAIRKQNANLEKPEAPKKKNLDIEEKIGPMVTKWVEDKEFCAANLNIKEVAAAIGTNQNYLSQYLNNHLGVTFQVWLNTLRVEESKILLIDGTRRSIEEIGTMVGFSQLYNFSRWFRTITGTTPFQFRKGR